MNKLREDERNRACAQRVADAGLAAKWSARNAYDTLTEIVAAAKPAVHFAFPPYRVNVFTTGLACVTNANGFNCLTFPSGATLTSPEVAEAICTAWNR